MIEFQNVSMAYKDRPVLNHVDLTIQDSEFCSHRLQRLRKTTLLKSINKLLNVQKGKLLINGTPVDRIKTNQLPNLVGYVVQAGGLFPHLTVEENIALVMRIARFPASGSLDRVTEMLRDGRSGPGHLPQPIPSQLSGGQQQRVGVARAFAVDPPIVLMDEPFSALDPMTRAELQDEIHTLQKKAQDCRIRHPRHGRGDQAGRPHLHYSGRASRPVRHPGKHPESSRQSVCHGLYWCQPSVGQPEYIRARDIMRRRPITISRGRTVLQALQIMRQSGVDSLLVVDGRDRLLGVLWLEELMSEKDGSGSAETYLSDDYVAVEGDTTLKEIISTIDYDVSGIIPVIEHDRTLVGFLTKSSLLATMSRQFVPEHTAGERSGVIWQPAH